MKLLAEPFTLQVAAQLVDPLGDDEIRSIGALREKVAHRSADRPRQTHDVSALLHDRELSIDAAHPRRVAGGDRRGRLGGRQIEEHVGVGIEEIDEPLDRYRSGHHMLLGQRLTVGLIIPGVPHTNVCTVRGNGRSAMQ